MTPNNIVGMCHVKDLDVIAITDHNSCKNCGAVMEAAKKYDLKVIPGMELTTKEEVHVLCLFEKLVHAMAFDEYVYSKLNKVHNKPLLFGQQQIRNAADRIVKEEKYLLINSTDISFSELPQLMKEYHGLMIPAHIDKKSYSLISNLGFIPEDSVFSCTEIANRANWNALKKKYPYLKECHMVSDSDAHYLYDIHERKYFLEVEEESIHGVLEVLGRKIRQPVKKTIFRSFKGKRKQI
ncbi:predicted metal-dependent phosphoesterase [Lachnospiraceae bacterium KM106-2]|nr:predicted metal-dependent phosphoesterase [Lachnospiraceae bacterium KM106-2]